MVESLFQLPTADSPMLDDRCAWGSHNKPSSGEERRRKNRAENLVDSQNGIERSTP